MTTTATTQHTCHGAVFCGQARAAAQAECPACNDHSDDASLPIDVRAARAWHRAQARYGDGDLRAEALRMAIRADVTAGDLEAAAARLGTLLAYADQPARGLLEVLEEHMARINARRATCICPPHEDCEMSGCPRCASNITWIECPKSDGKGI